MNIKAELLSLEKFGIKLGLENIEKVLSELKNPQNNIKTIHIAGTNGKGSTASMIESVLIENNNKVIKYTSPYLIDINEMFCLNSEPITDKELIEAYMIVKEVCLKVKVTLTLYEVTTVIVFLWAQKVMADYLILEVGLGGRYDATNVCKPLYTIITNISLDHTNILGDTKEKIAFEKAGIIKENIPLITTKQSDSIMNIFKERTSNIEVVNDQEINVVLDYELGNTVVEVENQKFEINLLGYHQAENFLLAKSIFTKLNISDEIIKKGLLKVKHRARMEVLSNKPLIIFDGAHNVASAKEMVRTLKEIPKPKHIIVSILKDKDIVSTLKEMEKLSLHITFVIKSGLRSINKKELSKLKKENNLNIEIVDDLKKAISGASDEEVTVVCGTFTIYEEVRKIVKQKNN